MSRELRSVPVIMFHGVAADTPDRPPQMDHWLDPGVFARYLEVLKRESIQTLTLPELREYRAGTRTLTGRAVVLTFDDGYLDFWLNVFPLLQRYEAKATVFVTTEFVDGEGPARTGDDVYPWGFLNWAEMRHMEASGLVDVQSHAVTHTWYPVGPRLVDVHRPALPWRTLRSLWWNRYPEKKPHWFRIGRHEDLPFGLPVLENAKSLLARRYFLDPRIEESLVSMVANAGGAAFFDRPDWRERYRGEYDTLSGVAGNVGRHETEEERLARLTDELSGSRTRLSEALGKDVRYLCCPGGSLNEDVLRLARELGYHGVSIPAWFERGLNRPGGNLDRFYRVTSTSPFRRLSSPALDAFGFRCRVRRELGAPGAELIWLLIRVLRRVGVL